MDCSEFIYYKIDNNMEENKEAYDLEEGKFRLTNDIHNKPCGNSKGNFIVQVFQLYTYDI